MKPQQCLFYHESHNCNNKTRNEHIIQKGLSGTLSSQNLICGNCNNFFSKELDTNIISLYEPIMNILSPFLSGKLKRRKKRAKLTSEESKQYEIEYVEGSANLSKINKIYSTNGKLENIIAPASISKKELEKIAKREGVESKTFKTVPLTEFFPNAIEKTCLNVSPVLMRAILLDILELADYVSVARNFPNIAKHRSMNGLRLWIRTGGLSEPFFLKNAYPWCAPVSDLLDPLFEPSTFSHRLIVCFDHKSKALVLIAQFVDTMPWLFILENIVVHSCSLSILYKKALVDGQDELITEKSRAVLDIRDIRLRKFSPRTHYALEFAKAKWHQEFRNQWARAYYESDLRNDNVIKQKLTYYASNSHSKINPSIDAVMKLVQNRYQGSRYISDILEITKKKASAEWTNGGNQKEQQILLYRECLKAIKRKFGYPML